MDKKDLEAIAQIVNSAVEGSNKDLREEIKQLDKNLREEMKQLDERLNEEMNVFEEKMLNKMYLFEQDYGKKIDAIFDVAVMQKDRAQEMYKSQEKFRIQVDNLDTKIFDLDQRVFKLEHR